MIQASVAHNTTIAQAEFGCQVRPLRVEVNLMVRTILTLVRLALDAMQVAFDREATGCLVLVAREPSAQPAARPSFSLSRLRHVADEGGGSALVRVRTTSRSKSRAMR